jgi:hypothetical protein
LRGTIPEGIAGVNLLRRLRTCGHVTRPTSQNYRGGSKHSDLPHLAAVLPAQGPGWYKSGPEETGENLMLKAMRQPALSLALAVVWGGALAACGGGSALPSLSSPFAKGTSDFDLTFLSASSTWDMNKDGTVTCDEWKQYATELLQESDGDKDSALTVAEWGKLTGSDKLFVTADHKYYDANGDGKVSLEELTGRKNHAFTLLDKNNDCSIGHDEKAHVYSVAKPKEKEQDQQIPTGGMGR